MVTYVPRTTSIAHIKQCLTESLKTMRDALVINNVFSHKVECGNELG